ncbi:MAG: copper chaperone PCu(A)C, partial [Gammaproteobacteria bacterium]|nr:copper chaperone PCu(A)C [Gammaproteobacteria bacterium]
MKASASLIIALVSTGLLASCTKPAVTIDNAWIRTPPPGMSMTAAYLTLHNKTAETITLVGATSEAFEQVTIHESRVVDGISEMIRLRSLSIAAGERLV